MAHSRSYSYSLMPTVLEMSLINLYLSIASLNPVNILAMLNVFDIFLRIIALSDNFILNFG